MTRRLHGTRRFERGELEALRAGSVIEEGILIFEPTHVPA